MSALKMEKELRVEQIVPPVSLGMEALHHPVKCFIQSGLARAREKVSPSKTSLPKAPIFFFMLT